MLGRPFSDFVSPSMLDDMLDKYRRHKAGEIVPNTYITILRRKDGSEFPAEINSASLYFQGANSEMVIVRDITERMQAEGERTQRLAELEAVNRISTALRTAENLEVMLPRLLDETLAVMNTNSGAIWLHDEVDGNLIPVAARGWLTGMSRYPQKDNEGVGGLVFTTGEVYISPDFSQDPQTRPVVRNLVPPGEGGVCVPIYSTTDRVGVFYVGVSSPRVLGTGEIHLLINLAEIAGNAIHRMRLHSQAVLHVQRLTALRIFDSAITSSLDLRLTLEVLIEQVTTQLDVDAADVLLLNENNKTLDYAAGKGFRLIGAALRPRVRVGEGLAGKAIRDRKMVRVFNPSQVAGSGAQGWLAQKERFKSYYGVPLISKGKIEGVLELLPSRHPRSRP